MTSDKKVLSMWILGFLKEAMIRKGSMNIAWVKQIFTSVNYYENDEKESYQAGLDLSRGS